MARTPIDAFARMRDVWLHSVAGKGSMSDTDWQTSTTLLRRLRRSPADESAWNVFVDRYGRLVYRWCRQWRLQPADAEDVTQTVLVELARQMRSFVYDPQGSFRGWLKTVAYRTWSRFVAARMRAWPAVGDDLEQILSDAAGADLAQRLEEESDLELLQLAMTRVQARVQPHTWEAFRLLALEERSGAETARHLGMNVGAVFVARSKVQRMLRQEVERLSSQDVE